MGRRKPSNARLTLIELLAPGLIELADALGDQICYAEGDWWLRHANYPLWSHLEHGDLTLDGARRAEALLRNRVQRALPMRRLAAIERATAVTRMLKDVDDRDGSRVDVRTAALDRGYVVFGFRVWEAVVHVGAERAVAHAATRAACLDALEERVHAFWAAEHQASLVAHRRS